MDLFTFAKDLRDFRNAKPINKVNQVMVAIATNDANGMIMLFHGKVQSDSQVIGSDPAIKFLVPGTMTVNPELRELLPNELPSGPFEKFLKAKFTWLAKNSQSSGSLEYADVDPVQKGRMFKLTKFQRADGLIYARSTDAVPLHLVISFQKKSVSL